MGLERDAPHTMWWECVLKDDSLTELVRFLPEPRLWLGRHSEPAEFFWCLLAPDIRAQEWGGM